MFGKHCLLHIKSAAVPFAICALCSASCHSVPPYMHSGELQCTVCSVVELCWTCVCKFDTVLNYFSVTWNVVELLLVCLCSSVL